MAIAYNPFMNPCQESHSPKGAIEHLVQALRRWACRSETRSALAGLDDRTLADIGLDPDHVRLESLKPFWRPLELKPASGDEGFSATGARAQPRPDRFEIGLTPSSGLMSFLTKLYH